MLIEDYQPGPHAKVSTHSSEGHTTLVFERESKHSPEKVWTALTEPEQVDKWAPYGPSRNLAELGSVTLKMNDGSTPEEYAAEVKQVIPNQLLEYSWGDSLLSWELAANDTGTTVTLRHTVGNPEWITPAAAGWHICLDIAELLLDGYVIGPVIGKAALEYGWEPLVKYYTEALKARNEESTQSESTE